MHKILITGGAGFIGSSLLNHVTADRAVVFDDLSRGRREYVPAGVDLIEGDVRDVEAVADACSGASAVIHLAAFGSVVESVSDPSVNFDVNVRGTFNVLEACRRTSVAHVILASTGGALVGDAVPPVNEMSLPRPISPYGASKLCGEGYCHAYAKAFGMRILALRFANIYGPNSAHKKGAVTTFMKAMLRGQPIPIFGDGSATRDYLHVDDLCRGIVGALASEAPGGEVFHLASGVETSVLKLAQLIRSVAGVPTHPIRRLPARPGEVIRNFADYSKAAASFGFQPGRSLTEGIAQTWQWYVENRRFVLESSETDS